MLHRQTAMRKNLRITDGRAQICNLREARRQYDLRQSPRREKMQMSWRFQAAPRAPKMLMSKALDVRSNYHEPPASLEKSPALFKKTNRIVHMFDHVIQRHEVNGVLRQRDILQLSEKRLQTQGFARMSYRGGIKILAVRLPSQRLKLGDTRSVATTDIEKYSWSDFRHIHKEQLLAFAARRIK